MRATSGVDSVVTAAAFTERVPHVKILCNVRPAILFTMLLLLGVPARVAWAAGTLVVGVPSGEYTIWLEYKDDKGAEQATPPVKVAGTKAAVDLAPLGSKFTDPVVVILDGKTGNVGTRAVEVKAGETKEITLAESDLTAVNTFRVRAVGEDGKPASGGAVTLTDGKGLGQTRPILPDRDGVVEFERVPFGRTNVKVTFADGSTLAQDIEVKADHAPGAFSVELAKATPDGTPSASTEGESDEEAAGTKEGEDSASETSPKEEEASSAEEGEARPSASSTGGIQSLVTLLILAGIAYGGYRMLREKGVTAEQALGRLGVQIPPAEPADDGAAEKPAPPPVQVPEGACPFCGQQKDPATGACACSVTASPDAAGMAPPTAPIDSGAPRLVVVQGPALGGTVTLTDAPAVIGRSAESDLPLVQDSTVSRRHASVIRQEGGYLIRDEGSSNGTFVNGQRVTEQLLRPGDEIQVGSTRIRFEA